MDDHQHTRADHEHDADRDDASAVAPLAGAGVPEKPSGDGEVTTATR
jgi:hypothetical protein